MHAHAQQPNYGYWGEYFTLANNSSWTKNIRQIVAAKLFCFSPLIWILHYDILLFGIRKFN